jgi:uncharacterized protein VirK/YbjX
LNTRLHASAGGGALKLAPGLRRRVIAAPARGWIASLRQRQDWPSQPRARLREAAKYLARALCLPLLHTSYLRFVQGHARLRACCRRDPRLLERHLHRFVNDQWSRRERLRALLAHYRFVLAALPAPLFDAIYVEGGVPLGTLALKDGRELVLSLRPSIDKGCEGELGIHLEEIGGRTLYRIVCTVIDDGRSLAIGCLQGPGGDDARELVRDLTKQMHGLRPKQLMLALACAFARHAGIERVLGIANRAHPLHRRRAGKFQADYDAFWTEQHGVDEAAGGWFVLPAEPARKSEAEVPSHHRAAFRRREALRSAAEGVLTAALGRSAPQGEVAVQAAPRTVAPFMPFLPQEPAWIP